MRHRKPLSSFFIVLQNRNFIIDAKVPANLMKNNSKDLWAGLNHTGRQTMMLLSHANHNRNIIANKIHFNTQIILHLHKMHMARHPTMGILYFNLIINILLHLLQWHIVRRNIQNLPNYNHMGQGDLPNLPNSHIHQEEIDYHNLPNNHTNQGNNFNNPQLQGHINKWTINNSRQLQVQEHTNKTSNLWPHHLHMRGRMIKINLNFNLLLLLNHIKEEQEFKSHNK